VNSQSYRPYAHEGQVSFVVLYISGSPKGPGEIGAADRQAGGLLLDHGRVGDGGGRVGRLVAVWSGYDVGRHRTAYAVAVSDESPKAFAMFSKAPPMDW
jgi:hypothetical protein